MAQARIPTTHRLVSPDALPDDEGQAHVFDSVDDGLNANVRAHDHLKRVVDELNRAGVNRCALLHDRLYNSVSTRFSRQ